MKYETIELDPFSFFKRLDPGQHPCFLTGGPASGWREPVIGFDPAEVFAGGVGDQDDFLSFVEQQASRGRKLIGYFSYDLGRALHRVRLRAANDLQLPDIYFCAFDNMIHLTGSGPVLCYRDGGFPDAVRDIMRRDPAGSAGKGGTRLSPVMSSKSYSRAYDTIKRYIYEGDLYQINFAHRLEACTEIPGCILFDRIVSRNPVGYCAYIAGSGFEVLSASPELFVSMQDGILETCPIKGTRPRGKTPQEDIFLREELLSNAKEGAELNMITDLLRNDAGKVCAAGSVRVAGDRIISRCPTVWHTFARVKGRLAAGYSPVQALLSMLPGGSVTGCPKKRAIEIIDELEPVARSVYTGAVGYINPSRDLQFSVAIRTVLKKAEKLYLYVGGGIVYDSVKDSEYQETLDKARSFMDIVP